VAALAMRRPRPRRGLVVLQGRDSLRLRHGISLLGPDLPLQVADVGARRLAVAVALEREEQITVLDIGAHQFRRTATPRILLAPVIIDDDGQGTLVAGPRDAAGQRVSIALDGHLFG